HSEFPAATMLLGPSPTPRVAVTVPVAGSILETVRSSELATHTAPGVIAMPAGPEPTCTGPSGWSVAGSIRVTVPSSLLATQTASGPAAMPSGRAPTWIPLFVTSPVAGAIRSTVLSPSLATH